VALAAGRRRGRAAAVGADADASERREAARPVHHAHQLADAARRQHKARAAVGHHRLDAIVLARQPRARQRRIQRHGRNARVQAAEQRDDEIGAGRAHHERAVAAMRAELWGGG